MKTLSNAELRIELACAEAERPTTIVGQCRKKNRIRDFTEALVERGAF
jgi:hypothetical protein